MLVLLYVYILFAAAFGIVVHDYAMEDEEEQFTRLDAVLLGILSGASWPMLVARKILS